MNSLYVNRARLVCYAPEPVVFGPGGPSVGGGNDPSVQAIADAAAAGQLDQTKVNEILARERRQHEARLKASLTAQQATLEELKASRDLTAEEKKSLELRYQEVLKEKQEIENAAELRTKQQRAEYEAKLKEEAEGKKLWEKKFRDREVQAVIHEAARAAEAFNPEQIHNVLRDKIEVAQKRDEKGNYVADFDIKVRWQETDPSNGQPVEVLLPVEEVVNKRMKTPENLKTWGNLFKSGVVSGLGTSNFNAAGANLTPTGTYDAQTLSKLTPEQYAKIRAENPRLLGLRGDKRRKV